MSGRTTHESATSRAFGLGSCRVIPATALAAAGLAAAALTGCGGGKDAATGSAPPVSAKVKAQLEAAHRQVTASQAQAKKQQAAPYGGVASFIPKSKPTDRVLSATSEHHVLASQGNTVSLQLAHAGARFTAIGPHVPNSVIGTDATKTTARFDVTLSDVHGTLRLDPKWFTITDQLGHVHIPAVRLRSGGKAPLRTTSGRTVALSVESVLPEGTGLLRYGPTTDTSLIGWDFTVETD